MERGIELLDWPPHSPDLNPIEHIWKEIKQLITKLHPEVRYLKKNKLHVAILIEWIKEAWRAVDQGLIDRLIRSMPRRMCECARNRANIHIIKLLEKSY